MPIAPGTNIGPYEVVGWLGAGGMGDVYRARDSRLARDVAIKVIHKESGADDIRLHRFEQEARAAGQLNHPNILVVYDVGLHDGSPYLVSELLDGVSLRSRIQDGPVPLRKAVDYARQTAEGLAAAHDKGIVHRDLKPDNLFVTGAGRIKILDFGIAKLTQPTDSAAHTGAATDTLPGIVVGTVGYMSPEQVRGEAVDARSDIFSFGAVLYEMLTGRMAFTRPTAPETMAAVLKEDPAPLAPSTSPALARIVARCLEKARDARFQSARDLAFGLEFLSGQDDTVTSHARVSTSRWLKIAGIAVAVVVLLAAATLWLTRDTVPLENLLVGATYRALTTWEGSELDADISPDGRSFVFIADRDGPFHVFFGQVDAEGFSQLTPGQGNQKNAGPTRSVGFSINPSEIWVNGTRGRRLRRISVLDDASHPFLAEDAVDVAWSRDGRRLVYFTFASMTVGDALVVADGSGGNPRTILQRQGYHTHFPVWSLDGRWIYFTHGKIRRESEFDVWRIPSTGGTPELVLPLKTDVQYLTLIDAGTMLYVAPDEDGSGPWLWAFDLARRARHRVNTGLDRYQSVAASANGRRLVASVARSTAGLWSAPILDRDRVAEERDVTPYPPQGVQALGPRFGGGSLFYLSESGPRDGLWRLEDGKPVSIWKGANGALLEPAAISQKDGRVAVVVKRNGRRHLALVRGDGASSQTLAEDVDVQGTAAWSRDEKWIVTGGEDQQGPGLFVIPVDGGTRVRLADGPAFDPVWSPTEDLIVYSGEQSANSSLHAVRLDKRPVPLPTMRVAFGGGGRARFLPDGTLLYLQSETGGQDFWLLDLATGKQRQITRLSSPATMFAFDVTPDGHSIVFDRRQDNSDIRLIDLSKR